MSILKALQWRYAAKRMNSEQVPEDKIKSILEAARLAPTSSGLQPFKIFVVTNQKLKERIKPLAFNQPQITECSHLAIFAAWDTYTIERFEEYFSHYEKERELPKGFSDSYKAAVAKQLTSWSIEKQQEHTAKQAYIAASFAMVEAAVLQVDASPMEGFAMTELDKLMKFDQQGLKSVLLLPIGYRDAESDWQTGLKKVRKHQEAMIEYLD